MKNFIRIIQHFLQYRIRTTIITHQYLQSSMLMQAAILSKLQDNKIKKLSDVEYKVFSQWGEDGIISWLTEKLQNIPNTFVEFGVENYTESNTRFLLNYRNWSGLIIDGSLRNILDVKSQPYYWKHDLTAINMFIDRENINKIISSNIGSDIGLLSIDIDGNDYWVWDSINTINPIIVICEYNAMLGDLHSLTIPYQAEFQRTKAHYSNLYFGASIKALISLGKNKGYTFVGTASAGCNAFFVRNDYAELILNDIEYIYAYPSKFREAMNEKGKLIFTNSNKGAILIADMPFIEIGSKKIIALRELSDLSSQNWKQGKGVVFENCI